MDNRRQTRRLSSVRKQFSIVLSVFQHFLYVRAKQSVTVKTIQSVICLQH